MKRFRAPAIAAGILVGSTLAVALGGPAPTSQALCVSASGVVGGATCAGPSCGGFWLHQDVQSAKSPNTSLSVDLACLLTLPGLPVQPS